MHVLIATDMEGVAGIAGFADVLPDGADFERGRRLLTAEASAAVRGVLAFDGGARVVVADGHDTGRSIIPAELERRARLHRGSPRPHGMMSGIADGVDAVVLLGYHGRSGTARSVLSHTMSGLVIDDVRCDGRSLGEIALNVAYAAAHRATPVLVTGDDTATAEALEAAPGIATLAVKRALGAWAADSLHPDEACARIEAAVTQALADAERVRPLRFDGPLTLEVDTVRPVTTEPLTLVPGLEHVGGRTLRYAAPDFTAAYRMLLLIASLADHGLPIRL